MANDILATSVTTSLEFKGIASTLDSENKVSAQLLLYMIEPIILCESNYRYYSLRANQTYLEYLDILMKRIDFFALSDLYDRVEMQTSENDVNKKIQQRHSDRLQELELIISN